MAEQQVVVIGCGVVGAAIAYTLAQVSNLRVTVLEADAQPGKGATGASLGVLMAACNQSKTGDALLLRLTSLNLHKTLIPELIAQTGLPIRYNQAGIVNLFNPAFDRVAPLKAKWQKVIRRRQRQGYNLQWLDAEALKHKYPQFQASCGLASPDDRAVDPDQLVAALVIAAQQKGVEFLCNHPVSDRADLPPADWYIIASGLGSEQILNLFTFSSRSQALKLERSKRLMPVSGQAIEVRLSGLDLTSVVHAIALDGTDINIVPLGHDLYWLGATVEFEPNQPLPRDANIGLLLDRAQQFCPALATADVVKTWAGDRPRPINQNAPILGFLPDAYNLPNVIVATGHYRNGVLMAPVTAEIVRDLIIKGDSNLPWRKFRLTS